MSRTSSLAATILALALTLPGGLSVFDLALALRRGFSAPGVAAGMIPLANAPVGVALAPGSRWIYVTTLGGFGPRGRLATGPAGSGSARTR